MINGQNTGFINEEELRNYINNKTYDRYNNNIKKFVSFVFGNSFNKTLPVKAEKRAGQLKPDLCLIHNGVEKYISVKKGSGNSVHQEHIKVFFPFVYEMLGEASLNNLKLFHYGDGTTNDTGAVRYNASECKKRYTKEVTQLNNSINTPDNLRAFLDRFLFIGNISSVSVDVVYHGTIESGLWASKSEIMNYLIKNNFNSNAVHFGSLTYQVWGRDEKRTAVHPDRRYVMQVKWGSNEKDLLQIRKEN